MPSKRTKRDLKFFSALIKKSQDPECDLAAGFDTNDMREKQKCRKKLLRKFVSPFTDTLLSDPGPSYLGFPLDYLYQRAKMDLRTKSPEKLIYPCMIFDKRWKGLGGFTSSGQVAVSAVFSGLQKSGHRSFKILSPLYWESIEFAKREGWKVSKTSKLGYLDSSLLIGSVKEPLEQAKDCTDLIVDTTAWRQDEPELQKILSWGKKINIRIYLVRSSMKLDSFGMEYGRLGSILILCTMESAYLKKVWENIRWELCYWGGYASTAQLYPFWLNSKFHQINNSWLASIQQTNLAVGGELKKDSSIAPVEVRSFSHGMFMWFMFPFDLSDSTLREMGNSLIGQLRESKFPAGNIMTYPWDVVAITVFRNIVPYQKKDNKHSVVRVSLPEFPKRKREVVTAILLDWARTFRGSP